MRTALVSLTLAIGPLIAGCMKSPSQIADVACPVIIRSDVTDGAGRMKALIDAGMSPKSAGMVSDKYGSTVSIEPSYLSGDPGYEKICKAAVENDDRNLETWRVLAASEAQTQKHNAMMTQYIQRQAQDVDRLSRCARTSAWPNC